VLYADAKMNKADWLTASAAMVGVVGIGFGLWWLDAVAAALISLDITKDGVSNLRRAVVDLMDQTPTTIDEDDADPLRDRLAEMLQDLDWVEDVDLRLREEGQVYFGEALVVPSDSTNIPEKVEDAIKRARDLVWRIYDLALTPVRELPETVGRGRTNGLVLARLKGRRNRRRWGPSPILWLRPWPGASLKRKGLEYPIDSGPSATTARVSYPS
jgi:hypothetical protein